MGPGLPDLRNTPPALCLALNGLKPACCACCAVQPPDGPLKQRQMAAMEALELGLGTACKMGRCQSRHEPLPSQPLCASAGNAVDAAINLVCL